MFALAGGVGGAKLANGFAKILSPDQLLIVVNTGDDFKHFGRDAVDRADVSQFVCEGESVG